MRLSEDPVFKKRPVNASQRLDPGSRVLLLSLKDALEALREDGAVLLGCICELPCMVAPLLRAARDNDAVMVLSPGGALAGPRALHCFFDLVRSAAEEVGTIRPVVLLPSPVDVEAGDPAAAVDQVHAIVDAGFTGLVLRIDELDPEESPKAVAVIAEPAAERELGVEILLSPGDEDEGGALAGALTVLGLEIDLVGVSGGGGVGLAALASEVEPLATSFREGCDDTELREALRNGLGAGVRMVSVRSVLTKAVRAGMSEEIREELADEEGGAPTTEALAAKVQGLSGDALDRVEARLYAEVDELLSLLRLNGSSRLLRSRLEG